MQGKVYIVRHCEATGQAAEADLTEQGFKQAEELGEFFSNIKVDRIISSPFLRAIHSIENVSEMKNLQIEVDDRLRERVLSTKNLLDWYSKLKKTYDDVNLRFEGGESSQEAMDRIVSLFDEVRKEDSKHIIIVTHGNVMSLLLKHVKETFSFKDWEKLSNPDVYKIETVSHKVAVNRIWRGE
ncbi:histidine phosphatase family protein [Metabacillus sp. HB246100]